MTDEPAGTMTHFQSFLADQDVPCPGCGYNLRGLAAPACPECAEALVLTVGLAHPKIGWFIALLAPSIFAGLLSVMIVSLSIAFGGPPSEVKLMMFFGFASGIAGIVAICLRAKVLRWSRPLQRNVAFATWLVHLGFYTALLSASM